MQYTLTITGAVHLNVDGRPPAELIFDHIKVTGEGDVGVENVIDAIIQAILLVQDAQDEAQRQAERAAVTDSLERAYPYDEDFQVTEQMLALRRYITALEDPDSRVFMANAREHLATAGLSEQVAGIDDPALLRDLIAHLERHGALPGWATRGGERS